MAIVRHQQVFFIVSALAGVAWTVSASELWVAGQRIIPDWIRGRMNATHMMVPVEGPGSMESIASEYLEKFHEACQRYDCQTRF